MIDPETDGDHCPALHMDEETGDLVFVGETVTDPGDLRHMNETSGLASHESAVRVPARMKALILEALRDSDGPAVR
ncbi:hypothetical protein ACIBEJ_31605 [Nonomuraea sp. NPDC050790]|uniref:hypothetical protein n=1 Tax=Nonomuraea sp. NPDC050790 TaxID=3364371 RepID=UPI0037A58EF9